MESTEATRVQETASTPTDELKNRENDNPDETAGAGDSINNAISDDTTSLNSASEASTALLDADDDSQWETEEEIELSDANEILNKNSWKPRPQKSPQKAHKPDPPEKSILQLKIVLKYCRPKIWRRILVSNLDTFKDLHNYIQLSMGWWDCHLHEFSGRRRPKGRKTRIIADNMEEESVQLRLFQQMLGVPSCKSRKENKTQLYKFLRKRGDKVIYMYDFGDGWTHRVVVEEVLTYDRKREYPRCVSGARACPPEDCGGAYGYQRLLAVRANPEHEDYQDLITDWLDNFHPDFDPDKFDPDVLGFFS